MPPDAAVARAAPRAGVELRARASGRPLRARRRRRAVRRALVDGHRLADRLHLARGGGVVARAGQGARCALGVEGIKADDGEGYYFPDDVRFADGTHRRARRVGARRAVPALDAARARRGPPRPRRAVRAQRLDRPAGDRDALGRRPGVGLLVAARARRRDDLGRRERLLELVARRRRLPRPPPRRALPGRAARALGAARLLHAAHAGPRAAGAGAVDLRRAHAGHLPLLRPAARAARAVRPRRGRDRARAAACRSSARCTSRPRRRARLDDRRRVRLRPGAVGRAGARRGRARRARSRCRAATGSRRGRASTCAAAARSLAPAPRDHDPGVGARRLDRRDVSGRARRRRASATRPSTSARSRRRCGASRALGQRRRPARRRHEDRVAARALVGRPRARRDASASAAERPVGPAQLVRQAPDEGVSRGDLAQHRQAPR